VKTRQLGNTEVAVSEIGLGCNNFGMRIDAAQTEAVVHTCLDSGITFFDTADLYGGGRSEEFLGNALGTRRQDIVVATKFGGMAKSRGETGFGSPEAVIACAEASLRRLSTDYIDVYQMHYPDPDTPIADTLGALDGLIREGKIRATGSSNFDALQIETAAGVPVENSFASAQNEWSLLNRDIETEVVPACEAAGVSMIPFFPLASGMLTGKYRRGEDFSEGTRLAAMDYFASVATDANYSRVEALSEVARDFDRTLLELALAWLCAQDCVASVIAGATRPEQVNENASSSERPLSWEELEAIEAALEAAAHG